MKLRKIFAFTLAEVLITLSILGVVAAITVPSLIKRQHRNEVETKLKKFVSTMQTALEISIAENGPVASWTYDSSLSGAAINADIMHKYISPYLNITEDHTGEENAGQRWKVTGPKDSNQIGWEYSLYCLKDGMCFTAGFNKNNPGHVTVANDGGLNNLTVDINGKKGPNVCGKDVFPLSIYQDKTSSVENFQIYGVYHNNSAYSNYISRCKSGDTQSCAEWIAKNNWKIPSDYPWL